MHFPGELSNSDELGILNPYKISTEMKIEIQKFNPFMFQL